MKSIICFAFIILTPLSIYSKTNNGDLKLTEIPIENIVSFIEKIKPSRYPLNSDLGVIYVYTLDKNPECIDSIKKGIEELNLALGGTRFEADFKVLPSITSSVSQKNINMFIGDDWQCSRVIKNYSNKYIRVSRSWNSWWFYDDKRTIYSALIVIDKNAENMRTNVLESLLFLIGYSRSADPTFVGNQDGFKSFFLPKEHVSYLTKFDLAIIRFCETYIKECNYINIKQLITEKWPLFAVNYDLENH